MSSNIEVQKICEFCGNAFTARTTVTRFCSSRCASRANKAKAKAERIEAVKKKPKALKLVPLRN